jgi:DNA-binding GntR family transcriptional regulator
MATHTLTQRSAATEPPAASSQADVSPIRRVSLHDQVTTLVRDMIIAGTLAPGSHIVESDLGQRLGVSRTPLRESLKTLAAEGLIDLQPARGAFVRQLTPDGLQHMLEVLTGLEAYAGRLACERATDREIAAVAALHDRLVAHYMARDRLSYVKANLAIHEAIVELSHNPELIATHKLYSHRTCRTRYAGAVSDAAWASAVTEHAAMIDTLRARDADGLARILRNHIALVWDRLSKTFNGTARGAQP